MPLFQKQKIFSNFFLRFVILDSILKIFKKEDDADSWCIFELTDSEKDGYINVQKVPF